MKDINQTLEDLDCALKDKAPKIHTSMIETYTASDLGSSRLRSEDSIHNLEQLTKQSLPDDLKTYFEFMICKFYSIIPTPLLPDSDRYDQPLFEPLEASRAFNEYTRYVGVYDPRLMSLANNQLISKEIKDLWWNSGWIPIGWAEREVMLCYDMDPTEHGNIGQIFYFSNIDGQRKIIAQSLEEMISRTIRQIEDEAWVYDPDKNSLIGVRGLGKDGGLGRVFI